ncbi:hypothetical protein A3844_26895 [Paenibacillus helianthi]|uniref:HAD family phosphatase n=1 Tax=Paenibacillus helianthi TaxID=1349432 RepID=A0ABX3EFW3_9BACL|nr:MULTISPECIES: HAD family phosphatase [Paenibacillus]OKP80713.1 hypothetical protein A3844_26895 [Paenibacillus helianthi]OKP89123.1 hypothetical protein A3848_16605 [Paenibacillus sp. P32E]
MKEHRIKALLFDCDGTLADTIMAHEKAYQKVFKQNSLAFDKNLYYRMFSCGSLSMLKDMTGDKYDTKVLRELIKQKNTIITEYLDRYMVPNFMLVQKIKESFYGHFNLGVVSNSSKISVSHIIERLGCRNVFDVILTKEDVVYLKPHPEIYLRASRLLKVKPPECRVFEDSLVGIEAASKAEMKTVKINIKKCNKKHRACNDQILMMNIN